jgi:hypothetical protein
MKKSIALVAMCATALSPIFATPAFAQVATPTAQMQATCAATAVVNPDPNSTYSATFDTASVTSDVGDEVISDLDVIEDIPGGQVVGVVGPTFTGILGRHGGSPNIFGEFETVTEYSGGSYIADVEYSQTTTFTYGCIVSKTNSQGKVTTPPGLQVEGLTIPITEVTRTERIEESNPNTFETTLADKVVCNSPEKNPGKWRNQNGYTGVCSTALFNSLPGMPIHSNSQPPLVTSLGGDLFVESFSSFADSPATVTDNDWTAE